MTELSHYGVSLRIDPKTQELSADVRLHYVPRPDAGAPSLLLHRDLKIERLEVDGVTGHTFVPSCSYPFTEEAGTITLPLTETLRTGRPVDIHAHYRGHLGVVGKWEVNRITSEWVEIGLYCPWFPWDPEGGAFAYRVELDIPSEYVVVGTGTTVRADGKWIITSDVPMNDITIIAAPGMLSRTVTRESLGVTVSFCNANDADAALDLAEQGAWVLGYMADWLQDASPRHPNLVVAKRDNGGGYARPGLVVLGSIGDYSRREAMFAYIAHEFAHFWWTGAPVDGWQDWLNEAFAEFSSMRAMRAKFGEQAYQTRLERKRQAVVGLPPIRGIDRQHEHAYDVLYNKGTLVLLDLEQLIGEAAFNELLRRFVREPVRDNDMLLRLLTDVAGEQAADQLNRWLDS